jgi:mannose-1-phosphate guanylyltransferase
MTRDSDFVRLGPAFLDSPSDSIDYAVMENTDRAAVVPLDAGWSDVGSWAALYDAVAKDGNRNALSGKVVAEDCSGSYVRASSRTVAAIGLKDVVIVETADSVLVMRRDAAQQVKAVGKRARELEESPKQSDSN